MSAYGSLYPGPGGGTRIAEFEVSIISKGFEGTLGALDNLEDRLSEVADTIETMAKDAPGQERELTSFLDKWGTAFGVVVAGASAAMAFVIASTPTLRANMLEMQYAFEYMAFSLGEQLTPEFEAMAEAALQAASDFDELPEAIKEAISDALLTLSLAGVGGIIGGAAAGPGGAIAGIIIGAIAGALITDLPSSIVDAVSSVLESETLIQDVGTSISGILDFTVTVAEAALALGAAIAGSVVAGITGVLFGQDAAQSVINAVDALLDVIQGDYEIPQPPPTEPTPVGDIGWFMQGLQDLWSLITGGGGTVFAPTVNVQGIMDRYELEAMIRAELDRQMANLLAGVDVE